MNSVFSSFKSNKGNDDAAMISKSSDVNSSRNSKKLLNLDETNNYEKLRHIREKTIHMSNFIINDHEINFPKASSNIPCNDLIIDNECDSTLPPIKPKLSSSKLSSSKEKDNLLDSCDAHQENHYDTKTSMKKNQDDLDNYASENNLLCKCCNKNDNSNASVNSLASIKSLPLNNNTCTNKHQQWNRNRSRLGFNIANSTSSITNQPSVHGYGLKSNDHIGQSRNRLSSHQRNLSLDFR